MLLFRQSYKLTPCVVIPYHVSYTTVVPYNAQNKARARMRRLGFPVRFVTPCRAETFHIAGEQG